MFPFWDLAIAPLLDAVQARVVVEIGALRGETTKLLVDRLGADAELHVIDPAPEFDPAEHEAAFAGRYVFHRDTSLRALPAVPAADVALIDGDHNWYTVINEMRLLAAAAREAGRPAPVCVLHDVCWPYGRRDLYYEPRRIPAESRQPFARRGIVKGTSELVKRGGLNPSLANALTEGGPRNGVMTALDDFEAEHDEPLRRLVLPVYFGLGIAVEQRRLGEEPALGEHLDWLESAEGQSRLASLAAELHDRAVTAQHAAVYGQRAEVERQRRRYLDVLKSALLDDHYFEDALRNHYLSVVARKRREPDPRMLRDPVRYLEPEAERNQEMRRVGWMAGDGNETRPFFPFTAMGRIRLEHLERCLDTLREEQVPGDLLECGVGRGGGAIFMRGYLEAWGVGRRRVWLADTFRAAGGEPTDRRTQPLRGDLNAVRDGFARFELLDERVRFLQGDVADAVAGGPFSEVALIRIGDALDGSPQEVLEAVYDRLSVGAVVLVEDYVTPARGASVDAFRERHGIEDPLERVDAASVFWRKRSSRALAVARRRGLRRTPLARRAPRDARDLSVVVVGFNMRRELPRTLHSLSRSYQRGVEDLDYEVLVVDNGSAPEQALSEELVSSYGPEFRYLSLGASAGPSPVYALNRGIAESRGGALALMIDGAHLLTPGVLRYGMDGLRFHDPGVVVTQQWYLGPGQQHETLREGYDRGYEDRLLEQIGWPSRGYDLFEVGTFVGDRDWFDPFSESNCLFVGRRLLEQVGGLDEAFAAPGGGFANLDLYERLASSPGVSVVTILGEGSFHQLHGGTTTNTADDLDRRQRVREYRADYVDLRGRDFERPRDPVHYVGRLPRNALRTRPRWRLSPALVRGAGAPAADGVPDAPVVVDDQLRDAFLNGYWHSLDWEGTRWLGQPVRRPAADLLALQELIARLTPSWIIETRGETGSALAPFAASICDLLGTGRVLTIGQASTQPHPRTASVAGDPADPQVAARVRTLLGDARDALVILGTRRDARIMREEYVAYGGFIAVDGYVVVEDTIVNGHPVWPSFGPGPGEVARALVAEGSFVPDRSLERFGPTFNPGGYLRRVK